MRIWIGLAALLAIWTSVLAAQDSKVKFSLPTKAGYDQNYRVHVLVNVGGIEAELTGKLNSKVTKADSEKADFSLALTDLALSLNGSDNDTPEFSPVAVTLSSKNGIESVKGGTDAIDGPRFYLLWHFPVPTAELEKDKPWKGELAASKESGCPKCNVEVTYLGNEDLNGKTCRKCKVNINEVGNPDAFSCEGIFWITENCQVLKMETTFKNLPIPAAGGSGSGKVIVSPIQ